MTGPVPAECTRCTLPALHPLSHLDDESVCRPCRLVEEEAVPHSTPESELDAALREVSSEGEIDAVVATSGGKDSCYTLLELARRTPLRLMAVTVDNGFLSRDALANARLTAEAAGAIHLVLQPPPEDMRRLFRDAVESKAPVETRQGRASAVCNACMRVVKLLCMGEALHRRASLLVWGWSPGQAPRHSALYHPSRPMLDQMVGSSREEILSRVGESAKMWLPEAGSTRDAPLPRFVHPLAFWEYDESRIREKLYTIGWSEPSDVDEHSTNCRLNALGNHVHLQRYGYHPYALEIAGLVREGWLTPEGARRRRDTPQPPELVEEVARELELDPRLRRRLGLV